MLYLVWHALWVRRTKSQHVKDCRSAVGRAVDVETRQQARLAALQRQQNTAGEQEERANMMLRKRRARTRAALSKHEEDYYGLASRTSTPELVVEPYCQEAKNLFSLPLQGDTEATRDNETWLPDIVTQFYDIPDLPMAEMSATMLAQLAKEFIPIIKRRDYRVSSVSEMCCCGDGLKGDDHGKVPDENIRHMCGQGYNCIQVIGHGRTSHAIHMRLRHPEDHNVLLGYDRTVDVVRVVSFSYCPLVGQFCAHSSHCVAFQTL